MSCSIMMNSNIVKYYYVLKELFSVWINFKMWFIPMIEKLNVFTITFSQFNVSLLNKSYVYI